MKPIPLTPGPGDYNTAFQDSIRFRGPRCLMNKSMDRRDKIAEDSPGPGKYHNTSKKAKGKLLGPAYSFGRSPNGTRVEADNRNQYNIPSTFPNIPPYQITKNMMEARLK